MPPLHPRSRRFRRPDQPSSPLRLTPRDLEILRLVAEHRFLTSVHLQKWLDIRRQPLLRRLQRLYHHGYVDRPRAQLDYYHQGGSRPMVYGLARRGAGRLRRDLNLPFSRMDWSGRAHQVGRLFLEHALLIADVMTALELACRENDGIRLHLLDGLSPADDASTSSRDYRWQVTLRSRQRLGIAPDRVFALEYTNDCQEPTRAFFFLEADRGTMPVTRSNLRQSCFQRKLLAYEATWSQGVHQRRFGMHRFRVLTVTGSQERLRHLVEATRQLEQGRGLFLFLDEATMRNSPDVLKELWYSPSGTELLMP